MTSVLLATAPQVAGVDPTPLPPTFPQELVGMNLLRSRAALLSDVLVQRVTGRPGTDYVTLTRTERSSPEATFGPSLEQAFPVESFITSIATRRGGDEVYIAGIDSAGTCNIKVFAFRHPRGSYALESELSPSPIGVPMPDYFGHTSVTTVGDEPWPGPLQQINPPRVRTLYSSADGGPFRAIAVDPEGRFLLLLAHADHSIYRLSLLTPGALLEELVTVEAEPNLQAMRTMHAVQDEQHGRVYVLTSIDDGGVAREEDGFSAFTYLIDGNNDGVLEGVTTRSFEDATDATGGSRFLTAARYLWKFN